MRTLLDTTVHLACPDPAAGAFYETTLATCAYRQELLCRYTGLGEGDPLRTSRSSGAAIVAVVVIVVTGNSGFIHNLQ